MSRCETLRCDGYCITNTLSQYPGGDYSTHRGKCQVFKNFPGLDLGVNFPPGR